MINIDYKDRRPICEQLVDKISELAARGLLASGSQLPSVRQLAFDLSINPNTIQKAYAELERSGVINSIKGRGSFISEDSDLLKKGRIKLILDSLDGLVKQAVSIDYSEEEFNSELKQLFKARREQGND